MRRTSSQHGRLQHPAHAQALRHPQDAGARRRAGAYVVAAELERFTDFGGRERVRLRVPRAALGRHRDGKDALPRGLQNATDDEAEDLPAGGRHQATAEVRRCQASEDAVTARDARWEARDRVRDAGPVGRDQGDFEGGYTLDDKQKEVYDQFTEMLADFDLYMMVNILEDALKDAQKKTMLEDTLCGGSRSALRQHPRGALFCAMLECGVLGTRCSVLRLRVLLRSLRVPPRPSPSHRASPIVGGGRVRFWITAYLLLSRTAVGTPPPRDAARSINWSRDFYDESRNQLA